MSTCKQFTKLAIIVQQQYSWRGGIKCDCKTDSLWVRSPLEEIKYFIFPFLWCPGQAALSSATQHAMTREFGRKWGTECLNTRFPLFTLLCAGYSVKLIYFDLYFYFLFFAFLRSGVEVQRGVEFRHLTRMPLQFGRKRRMVCLTLGSLCLPCCVRDTDFFLITLFYYVDL